MSFEAAVHAKAIRLDTLALQMTGAAGSGHPTTATSLGHVTTVLMYHSMRWVPEEPGLNTSDRLVLSEGHAVPIIYAAFIDLGAMVGQPGAYRPACLDDINGFRATDSPFDGHPNPREGITFFDAATGSLIYEKTLPIAPNNEAQRDASVYSSVSLAGNRIYVSNTAGETVIIKPGKKYKKISVNRLAEGSAATPVFSGNRIYTRSGKSVICIEK